MAAVREFDVPVGTGQISAAVVASAVAVGTLGFFVAAVAGSSSVNASLTTTIGFSASAVGSSGVIAGLTTNAVPNRSPVVSVIADIVFFAGVPKTVSLFQFATDPDNDPLTVSLNAVPLNNHVTFDPVTGLLSYDGGALAVSDVAETTTDHIATFDDGRYAIPSKRVYDTTKIGAHSIFDDAASNNLLSGFAGANASVSGALTTVIQLQATVVAEATANATLPPTNYIGEASALAEATVIADLRLGITLRGEAAGFATAGADLLVNLALQASVAGGASVIAGLSDEPGFLLISATAVADATAAGLLMDRYQPIAGVAFSESGIVANLSGGSIPIAPPVELAAVVFAQAFARGDLLILRPSYDGLNFWSECARCAERVHHRELVADGQIEGLLVCSDCYDPKHPLEEYEYDFDDEMRDPIISPEISIPAGTGYHAPTLAFDEHGRPVFL